MQNILPTLGVYLIAAVLALPATVAGQTITAAEYFLNADPGPGNGTAVEVPQPFAETVDVTVSVPPATIAALPDGTHRLVMRVRDNQNRWAQAHTRYFYKSASSGSSPAPNIVGAEYYLNLDPGPGNGTAIAVATPAPVVDLTVTVPANVLAALPDGTHRLTTRVLDANGRWSLAATRFFHKSPPPVEGVPRASRIDYRWYQSGSPVSQVYSLTASTPANPILFEELAPMDGFVEGQTYQLVLTPYDETGRRGISVTQNVLYQPVSIFPPTLSSPVATGITSTSATLGGSVTGDGGAAITERGIVYSPLALNGNPLIGGPAVSKIATSGTTGVFAVNAGGLTHGTVYAFKAYATNSEGTTYSNVGTFITDTNITFGLNGIGTVANRAIGAGETQKFRFTLTEARAMNLSTAGSTGLSAELLDGSGNVVATYGGSGFVNLNATLPPGNYDLRVTNPGDNAETFTLTLDASTLAEARPLVTVSAASLVSQKLKRVRATASVRNTGNLASAMRLRGTRGNKQFAVVYTSGGNVTAAMSAGTFTTAVRAADDAPVPIALSVSPNRRTLLKKGKVTRRTFNLQITATAVATPARSGSAGLRVRTR